MTQSPITVTYSLEEILSDIKQSIKEVNHKLDDLKKDVQDLKVGQVRLETELNGISKRLENQEFIPRLPIKTYARSQRETCSKNGEGGI